MSINGYGRRKLPYPYSYLVRQTFLPPEQNTGRDYTSEYNPSAMNFYVLAMLPEEQLRFTSALQAGADLIYPDDMVDVQSAWLYAREYPNDFTGGGIVSICDAVATCINDSSSVRAALNSAIGGNGGNGGFGGDLGSGGYAPIPSSVDNQTNLISGATCTNDNLYGIAKGIVDTAMQVVTDAYEIIEFTTNGLELAAAMSDNFPAWVSAGLGTAAELGNWIQENAHDAFLAYDTLSTRTSLACDLYCLMKDQGCTLTYDDLALFFIGRAAITIVGNSLADLASVVAALTTADEVGTTSLAIMFGTLNLGSRFGGLMGASSFMTVVQSYLDEFDPSWADCDDCPDGNPCDFPMHVLNPDAQSLEPCVSINEGVRQYFSAAWLPHGYYIYKSGTGSSILTSVDVYLPLPVDAVNVTVTAGLSNGQSQMPNAVVDITLYDAQGNASVPVVVDTPNLPNTAQKTWQLGASYPDTVRVRVRVYSTGSTGVPKTILMSDVYVS